MALDDDHGRIEFEATGLTVEHAYAHLVHEGAVAWMVSRFNHLTATWSGPDQAAPSSGSSASSAAFIRTRST